MHQFKDLHEWLDQEDGRSMWLADQLDRSKTAVSLWRNEGVPLPLIPRIAELTGYTVSVEAMLRHAMERKLAKSERPSEPAAAGN